MAVKTTFWKLLSETKIEIPHYQRDYVQGWTDTNTNKSSDKYEENRIKEIREGFVWKLFDVIKNEKLLSLNLVFGSANGSDNYFVPVDGQQRLTTLFLVHWYLALKAGELSQQKTKFSNFIYQTRKTSNEFFNLLIDLPQSTSTSLTVLIRNNNRFFSNHLADPTVLALIVMIEEIEKAFVDIDFKKAFQYLTSDPCLLSIDVINLGTYKLSDELYIKMNSRGKPLTYFEKFKAWLPDYINDLNKSGGGININLPKDWNIKLDTKWLDLFWKYKDDDDYIVDQEYMRFFHGMIQLLLASDKSTPISEELKDKIKLFNNPKENENKKHELELSLEQYEKLECINEPTLFEITKVLDELVENDTQLSVWLKEINFFNKNESNDNNKLLIEFISGQITYNDRLRFYAMYKYLLIKGDQINEIEFKRWIRVLRNLIENTSMNEENFIRLTRKIDDFSQQVKGEQILPFLISKNNADLAPFDSFQFKEEQRKASLIVENPQWEKEILTAEAHPFFKGQIFLLLEMSDDNLEKFIEYRDKAISIFKEGGLVDDKDCIVHLALLAKGDYLFNLSSNRKGFCKNAQQWRERIFKDNNPYPNHHKGRIGIVKDLLDEISIENPRKCLNDIIEKYEKKDWRYYFIKFPYTLAVCREKLINFSGDNEIYLLNKSRMSSIHWEERSFCFFKNFIEPERYNYHPFTKKWYFGSSNYDKPCAVLDKFIFKNETYKIDIHFNKDGKYIISLFIDEAKGDEQELLSRMVDQANLKMNWGEYKRFFLSCKDEADTKNKLDTICTNLKELADTENTVPNEIPI